ncbi:MAG: hypothetical protein ACJ79K_16990 [Gemmatimonadaceae bacterium]
MSCSGGKLPWADCASIVQAVHAARASQSSEYSALRAAVVRCAETARRAQCPPERFLVALKDCLPDDQSLATNRWRRDIIRDRIVSWAIAGYYDTPDAA